MAVVAVICPWTTKKPLQDPSIIGPPALPADVPVSGFFHILVLIATLFVGEGGVCLYWRLFELLEALLLVLIIVTAWRWPKGES